jgi:Toastrack DUF4097
MHRIAPRLAVLAAAFALVSAAPASADYRLEKNLKLDPGGKLSVSTDVGSIEVKGTTTSGAHVVLTSQDEDIASKFDMSFEELPGEVKIVVKKKKGSDSWFGFFRTKGMSFEIQVPMKTRTELSTSGGHLGLANLEGDVQAETSGGHISLEKIAGNVHVETSGGHIQATSIDGPLWAETSGGHIEIHKVSKDIHAETSGGSIEIDGAGGRVDADTSGGHVEVAFTKGNAHGGRIESSGGSITVTLDPTVNLNLDASTSAGSVSTDIPMKVAGKISRSEVRGTLGSGGEMLSVSTSGGSVHIVPIGGETL